MVRVRVRITEEAEAAALFPIPISIPMPIPITTGGKKIREEAEAEAAPLFPTRIPIGMASGGGGAPWADGAFPDWVMLNRIGRTKSYDGICAVREAVNQNKTAAAIHMASGRSCYVSFALADPPEGVSYFDLHWPEKEASATRPACPYVRATDEDLVLFHISIPSQTRYFNIASDLFVYTAAGPSPSVQQLPRYTKDRKRPFLMDKFATGILQLAPDCYIVADLNVYPKKSDTGNNPMLVELCIFNSEKGHWGTICNRPAPRPHDQSNVQFPFLWSTDDVLALDGRFLCWVDYFSGVLISDFSDTCSPVLHFVPFPGGKEYHDDVRVERYFSGRFQSVSVSQGMLRFVHIDNDFHERIHGGHRHLLERRQGQHPRQKITIWDLNMMSKFKWELHRVIYLDSVWGSSGYQELHIPRRLPEFPIISADDPDIVCCLLREEEFHGEAWMIMVDMKQAHVQSCTPYINQQSCYAKSVDVDVDVQARKSRFANVPLLPAVFSRHLERPTGMLWNNDKLAPHPSKKSKFAR
ncbi:hypothetical protein VPH35_086114 [Triticum aestivum]|uniref:DUF1618 domain-containing protein n=1 Tax=Triticum aestivum TaxID=4565 RepID=A0A3B6KRB8_WHEAT|nr:uncharacterized protein LOC123105473 isoform X1 [Triticum aestivum]